MRSLCRKPCLTSLQKASSSEAASLNSLLEVRARLFSTATGLASVEECPKCPAGSYCSLPGLSEVSGKCESGYICYAGSTSSRPTSEAEGSETSIPAFRMPSCMHWQHPNSHSPLRNWISKLRGPCASVCLRLQAFSVRSVVTVWLEPQK